MSQNIPVPKKNLRLRSKILPKRLANKPYKAITNKAVCESGLDGVLFEGTIVTWMRDP